jgi:hypothetical protein
MSNVGSNAKNSSDINTTDVDFLFADTDWQALFDIDFELRNVPPANVPSNPVQSVQSMPVQFNSPMEANNRNVMPAVSNYNYCSFQFLFKMMAVIQTFLYYYTFTPLLQLFLFPC